MTKIVVGKQTIYWIKYLTTLLYISTLVSSFCNAQNVGVVRGFLTDSLSGEALPYGNILIKELNEGTATDNNGYYLMHGLPAPSDYTFSASYIGYQSKEKKIRIVVDGPNVFNIQLVPTRIEISEIEKVEKRIGGNNKSNISVHSYTVDEIETLPQGVETDIFRSIKEAPGVTGISDISAKFNVRGGSSNQNLVILNDATVYNPFHALGMFSIVDPDMINSVDFYKGGFPTEFSGRVSSVTELVTKRGNINRFSATAAASLLTGKVLFEGPIPNGSFILTGRKSISNEVLKSFYNNKSIPIDFYDFSFNVNYANNNVWKDARFVFHGFWSGDNIIYDDPLKADYRWQNNIYGLSYFQTSDSPLFYRLSLNVSNFDGEVDPNLSKVKPKQNEVNDITYKADFTYVYQSKDIIDAGLKVNRIKAFLYLQNSYGELATIGSEGATVNGSIYLKYQMLRFKNLGVDVGTRYNLISLGGGGYNGNPFEPRFRLKYYVNSLISMQISAGVFLQEITTLSDEDEVISLFDPWIIMPGYISATRSVHYNAGLIFSPTQQWEASIEGYYKKTTNVPFLNREKIFPSEPDLIVGENEAYGVEFINNLIIKNISLTGSYALAWTYNVVGNIRYRPRYDIRHSLNLLLHISLGAGWSFSSSWAYKSNTPFKKLIGYYDKFYFNDNPGELSLLNMYTTFMLLDKDYTGRTPDYHRLDLSLVKKFELPFMKLDIGVSVLNVYDRKNLFYFNIKTGERVNMLPFLPSLTLKAEF